MQAEPIVLPAPIEVRAYSLPEMAAWGGRSARLREHSRLARKVQRARLETCIESERHRAAISRIPLERVNRGRVSVPFGSSAFLPSDVSSVSSVTWVRADLQCSGALWEDQFVAGTGDFSQGTGGFQPAYTTSGGPNNKPYLTGDGVDDEMTSTINRPSPGTTPTYIAFVGRQETWTGTDRFYAANVTGSQLSLSQNTASPQIRINNNSNGPLDSGMTVGSWFVVQVGFFNTTSDFVKVGSATKSAGTAVGNNDPGNFSIFGAVGALWANVSFAELVMYAGEPSGGELSALGGYWSTQFGLAS